MQNKNYMHSFSRRLTRRIVLALMLTLALVNANVLYQATRIMGNMTNAYYAHVADIENEKVEKRLHDLQVAVRNSIDEVEWQLANPDSIYVALEDKLKLNPQGILGFGVGFVPDYYPEKGRWFEPYAMWLDGKIELMQNGSAESDYFPKEWYREGLATDSDYWSDPYFINVGDSMIMICTYSMPVRDPQGRKVGVFGGDLSLDMIHDYLLTRDVKSNTVGLIKVGREDEGDPRKWLSTIVVGRHGDYISHPDEERILHDNFFEDVTQKPDTVACRMVSDMKARKKGYARLEIDGVPSTVYYTPLERTGWSLVVILPDYRFRTAVINLCIILSILLIAGLLAVYLISRITIRHAAQPLRFLAESADEVAKGNFNAPLPTLRHNDEIRLLRDSFGNMQQSLSQYIDELKTTTAQKSAIESELSVARSIQMSMLTKDIPARPDLAIHAMLTPAKAVGGDLYDFFIRDNCLYFCIGDVAGKGVPAALVMTTARGAFRLLSESESEPVRIISRMNDMMTRDNPLSIFITFFAGVLDLATGRLRFCNAGHKAPYAGAFPLSVKRNLPIGAMRDWTFEAQEIFLAPGTTLFLYTDGLDEAEDAGRNLFGKDRIGKILQDTPADPRALIERMTQAVACFAGGTEQSDDLTMLALQWKK